MKIRIGIQGGKGSFNEMVALTNIKKEMFGEEIEILYLYTTQCVLAALQKKEIEYGQFALYNSYGGLYEETLCCLGSYPFRVVSVYKANISHCLMIHPDIELSQVSRIISHDQVFKQCKNTLAIKYQQLVFEFGQNDLADTASVAEKIRYNSEFRYTATITNKHAAEIYDLQIIDEGMADSVDSTSTFLLVSPWNRINGALVTLSVLARDLRVEGVTVVA